MVSSGHVQTKNCTKIRLQSDPPDGVYSAAAYPSWWTGGDCPLSKTPSCLSPHDLVPPSAQILVMPLEMMMMMIIKISLTEAVILLLYVEWQHGSTLCCFL